MSTLQLSVAALLAQVRLVSPQGTVTVQGMIEELKPFPPDKPTIIYGVLSDTDSRSKLSFGCSVGAAPKGRGECAILQGTLTLRPTQFQRGYELHLVGSKIGNWTPDETIAGKVASLEKFTKQPLARFVEFGPEKKLLFVGTRTALQDAATVFNRKHSGRLAAMELAFTQDKLSRSLPPVAAQYDAFCFVRGGGDPNSFALWSNVECVAFLLGLGKPFYTALGHAADLTLADKFADESFPTPTAISAVYADALETRAERAKTLAERDTAVQALERLQLESARERLQMETTSARERSQLQFDATRAVDQSRAETARIENQLKLEMGARSHASDLRERVFRDRKQRDLRVILVLGGIVLLLLLSFFLKLKA